jgi:hypothetical protein
MVCPTCYCFDVNDEVGLGSRAGTRVRSWDSCLFKSHALVAGGENFRHGRASRIKFRFYHKQRGFVADTEGRAAGVAGVLSCPVGIDTVAAKMIESRFPRDRRPGRSRAENLHRCTSRSRAFSAWCLTTTCL